MITVLFHMTAKSGRQDECHAVMHDMHRSTHAEDDGCLAYAFYQRADSPDEYVLFEQWRDADVLNAHVTRCKRVYGPPSDDEPYPPTHHRRRLPAAFLALFERTASVRYEPIS